MWRNLLLGLGAASLLLSCSSSGDADGNAGDDAAATTTVPAGCALVALDPEGLTPQLAFPNEVVRVAVTVGSDAESESVQAVRADLEEVVSSNGGRVSTAVGQPIVTLS